VLRYMDRSTIHYLRQKGWTKTQIAAFVGHHRDTIAQVLKEPVDQQPIVRPREPLAAAFAEQIERWLEEGLSVRRMVELARADAARPFTGSDVAFYNDVRPLRQAPRALPAQAVVRFEGLPGELVQIDWGEHRQMPFTKVGLAGQTCGMMILDLRVLSRDYRKIGFGGALRGLDEARFVLRLLPPLEPEEIAINLDAETGGSELFQVTGLEPSRHSGFVRRPFAQQLRGLVGVVHQRGLRDFEAEVARLQAGVMNRLLDDVAVRLEAQAHRSSDAHVVVHDQDLCIFHT